MTLPVQEKSKYFKSMLILMRKDRKITEAEKKILIDIGKVLGFEQKFCLTAIKELLDNEYLIDDVPRFSNKEFAKSFIIDGLRLAVSDNELNPEELEYLTNILKVNEIDDIWFGNTIKQILNNDEHSTADFLLNVRKYI
ncbi:MAG: hypothetical protein JW995_11130 [Melioribacteraceae bacterium]|nr:hypothetical protein [Melioribacteraceae bacterium]